MALRFIEGFDHYLVGSILHKWTGTGFGAIATFPAGRFGGSGCSLASRSVYVDLSAQAEWVVGFGFKITDALAADGRLLQLSSSGTSIDDLYFDGSVLSVRRGGTATLGTGTTAISINTWHYVELRIVISDTVGVAHVVLDGVDEIGPLTSQDTKPGAATTSNRFLFGDQSVALTIDDVYILDASGSAPYNTFLGDCKVEALLPSGNGTTSDLDGSDGNSTDNYLLVDETAPDSDTTYVESAGVGDKDTYAYGNLATTSGTIYAVQILPWARKTDAGTRTMVTVARLSGTEEDSSAIALPSSYTYAAKDIRTTRPGGGAWTVSDVNSAEFGVKVDS